MLCPNCQKEIAEASKFCYNCGANLTGSPAPATSVAAPKRLMRSCRDKRIAGVCAGLAEYFDLDPTLVRVLWLLAIFFCWHRLPRLHHPLDRFALRARDAGH